jgi:hypothetical protein
VADIDRLGFERRLARKCEKSLRQRFSAARAAHRVVGGVLQPLNWRQWRRVQASLQRLQISDHEERRGVCRDFAHLAVTLSRCMNIPARYCTGYLGDIGVPADPAPMDFSAWYEVFLDGRWLTFDARHNHPRIGRIVIARGRDAADVAISTAFGPAQLVRFKVITEELKDVGQDRLLKEAA